MTAKASDHIKPCNIAQSERHNRRDTDYIKSLNPKRLYIRTDLTDRNETYVAPEMEGISLQQHYDNIRTMVKQKTGRAMQEKDVEFTDKKGRKRMRQGCSPIRESVVNIKPGTMMNDLMMYVERVHERWGIRALQIHIHRDEGHYENPEVSTTWEPNLHAHIIWDWMDHSTGKSYKLNADDMSVMQDMVAETLDMERGQKKAETGIEHLERNDFIIQKQESKKRHLQDEAEKAVAEREEAEMRMQTAKETIEGIRQERIYLVEGNRTKEERKKRLDMEIQGKESRYKSLDDAIQAKSRQISQLDSMADDKVREIYALKERGDWQYAVLRAVSAYVYRADEGFRFCINAIQDFAYSGAGCRGGKHGDIFWDNEAFAIKHYMQRFADFAAIALKEIASWFVWLAKTLGNFNDSELRRAHREVNDIAEGKYDWRIQRFENQQGLTR